MTTVAFSMEGDRIVSFEVRGHSGYAEEGEDIVCAAVSSAVNLDNAWLSFHLPGGLSVTDEATCQNLLAGLMVYFAELHQAYPDFFQVVDDSPEDNAPE